MDIGISEWQMHSRPAGNNAGDVIASFCSSSRPSIQLPILSNVSYNHLQKFQDEVFQLEVTVVTEPGDSYAVRSSETWRDSQCYLLAMVYHIEMHSLRTILFVTALNLIQIPKVVYQYNHN